MYVIYSGLLFYIAATMFLIAVAADRFPRVAGVLALLAIALAAFSGTPMRWFVAIPTLAATLGYTFLRTRAFAIASVVMVLIAVAFELPYSVWDRQSCRSLVVLGDSLSSGGFGERTPWPSLIGAKNLAMPSATTADALEHQVPQLSDSDCVVIELGGNDMLDGVPPAEFARNLDRILAAVRGRRVMMFELPLLPGRWSYGAIQRRLAKKHGATLIPKRVLARALTRTYDGLHLTQEGHDALALIFKQPRAFRPGPLGTRWPILKRPPVLSAGETRRVV